MCECICVRIDKFSSTCAWLSFEEVSGSKILDMKLILSHVLFIFIILVAIFYLFFNNNNMTSTYLIKWNMLKLDSVRYQYQFKNNSYVKNKKTLLVHLKKTWLSVLTCKWCMMTNLKVVTLTRERKQRIASYLL